MSKPSAPSDKTTSQTWYSKRNPAHKRTDTVATTYDDFGNLLTQINANGVTETSSWYKAEGEDGCPPDPQKFVRNLKDKTITPAPSDYGQAPILATRYTYTEQSGLSGNGPWLAVGEETLVQVVSLSASSARGTVQGWSPVGSEPNATGTVAGSDLSPRLPALSNRMATAYWVVEPYPLTTSAGTSTSRSAGSRPVYTIKSVISSVGKGGLVIQTTLTDTSGLFASIKSGMMQKTPLSRAKTASVITGFSTISIMAFSGSTQTGPVLSIVTGTSGDSLSLPSFQFFTR